MLEVGLPNDARSAVGRPKLVGWPKSIQPEHALAASGELKSGGAPEGAQPGDNHIIITILHSVGSVSNGQRLAISAKDQRARIELARFTSGQQVQAALQV
jgi:hypothetical protein